MHYICTGGCGAVVENPGTCQAMACPNYGHQFEPCDCTDNQHYGKMKMPSGSSTVPEKKKKRKSGGSFGNNNVKNTVAAGNRIF